MIANMPQATQEVEATHQNEGRSARSHRRLIGDGALPRWLHWWAWLTLLLAFLLIGLGAEVTTKKVGMVDPDAWRHFTTPGLFVREWQQGSLLHRGLGWMIEHGHRFVGQIVGLCTIVLAAGIWFGDPRRPHKWVSLGALAAVSVQGLLGIFRVQLHAILGATLALIHGWTAQLVIGLLAMVTAMTADYWNRVSLLARSSRATVWTAWGVTAAVFLQLVLGGMVRHDAWWIAGRLHILGALVVCAALAWFLMRSYTEPRRGWQEKILLSVLIGVFIMQVLLGIESWLIRFAPHPAVATRLAEPLIPEGDWIRSLHYMIGSMLLGLSVAMAAWVTHAGAGLDRLASNGENGR